MGLEALPARWHLAGVSSTRPAPRIFPVDIGTDGVRTLLTRRSSEAVECSQRSYRCQAVPKASADGGAPGFSNRDSAQSVEKGSNGGQFLRSEGSWNGQAFPEPSVPSSRLLRWQSDGVGLKRMAAEFQNFPGDNWGKYDDELCEVEAYPGLDSFERLDGGVAIDPSWLRSEAKRFESQGKTSNSEQDWTGTGVSAVDVTAPSFVTDRKFVERSDHCCGLVGDRQEVVGFVDQQLSEGTSIGTRSESLQRKAARVYTAQGDESMRQEVVRADKVPIGLGERAACISIPTSLRSLKKRNARGGAVSAIKKAFDSMVDMIRALQSYTLQMRNILVADIDVQQLMSLVHREMHTSFVWLFQQVFACTPTLMVSVMILLVNFTVHSLGDNVAFGAQDPVEPSTHLVSLLQARGDRNRPVRVFDSRNGFTFVRLNGSLKTTPPSAPDSVQDGFGNSGSGGAGGRAIMVAGGEDGDYNSRGTADRNSMFSEEDSNSADLLQQSGSRRGIFSGLSDDPVSGFASKIQDLGRTKGSDGIGASSGKSSEKEQVKVSDEISYQMLLERTAREFELRPGVPYHYVELDPETLRVLVAPVVTRLESDNYPCFDRTDLEYQHAISSEPTNSMLLANYAQFLYAVRHDNSRAEGLFRRALKADSKDGDILARWASFLWLALKDRSQAEKAYRSAIALDPSNPYHAGSYAHFLWHAGDDDSSPCLV